MQNDDALVQFGASHSGHSFALAGSNPTIAQTGALSTDRLRCEDPAYTTYERQRIVIYHRASRRINRRCPADTARLVCAGWAGYLLACFGAFSVPAVAASAAQAVAPPLQINLDAFEAMKKKVALPDGETLAYLQMGNRNDPPVVLIHGYTDNARDWVPMLPYLPRRYRLILIDLRGHGQSSKPDCCYSLYDFAYDIKLLLDRLRIKRADIVGHSLGSLIAQTFAETWPGRTRKVVLISSTGGKRPCTQTTAPEFDFAPQIRALKEPLKADSPFMIAWWDSPTPVNGDFIRREREDSARIPLRVWIAVLDQALTLTDLQSGLPRLKAPTLLLWGSKDPIMGPEDRATLRAALPSAEVEIFDGLGHNPMWEQPRKVADAISRFLDE